MTRTMLLLLAAAAGGAAFAQRGDANDPRAPETKPPPVIYRSRVTDADDHRIVLWHGDAGYEAGDPAVAGPRHRLVMRGAAWTFESSGEDASVTAQPSVDGDDASVTTSAAAGDVTSTSPPTS